MDYNKEIQEVKDKLLNRILFTTIIFALIPFSFSLLRYFKIGWQPIFFVHSILLIAALGLFLLRKKINFLIKAHGLFSIYLTISLAGLFFMDLVGGWYFIILLISLASILLNIKQAILYTSVFLVFFLVRGWLKVNEILINSVDFNTYLKLKEAWISHFTGLVYVAIILFFSLDLFNKFFRNALSKATKRTIQLGNEREKLKSVESKFEYVVETGNDGYVFVDENFIITYVNGSYSKLSGYSKEELIGKQFKFLVEDLGFDWTDYFASLASLYHEKKNAVEISLVQKSGKRIPTDVNVYKSENDDDMFMWGVVKDLREKKKLENKIFSTMIQAEEKERERYAKELHDGHGPLLSTAMIYINAVKNEKDYEKIKDYSVRAFDILKEAALVIKEISNNLTPLVLKQYGMVQAVRSFIEKAQNVMDMKFTIEDKLEGRFNKSIEITIYRTLIELTNNSIKYSRAKNVKISFLYKDNRLVVDFNDNGIGFDYQKAIDNNTGFGLLNLENRIKKLGGKYNYSTSQDNGVNVTIKVQTEYL